MKPSPPLRPVLATRINDVAWPAIPPPAAQELLSIMYQLEQSQWWPAAILRARQLDQLGLVAAHAAKQSPFYRARFAAAGVDVERPWTDDTLRALPPLTRTDLLTRAGEISCREVPPSHGPLNAVQTSGSTGQIVEVKRTGLTRLMWLALVMRDHVWHERNFDQTLVSVRANLSVMDDDAVAYRQGWGPPVTLLYPTGPCYTHPLSTDLSVLAEWLLRRNPGYLLIYPTALSALVGWFERHARRLERLIEIRTIGETVSDELRARARAVLGARIVDNYSSQEVGNIACQCPDAGDDAPSYHVHAESLIVEVIDDAGRPCRPGEIGRVLVTDLHNFATPLIRYDIGDHAEVGAPCACGRGLPTLARIAGRQRNMVVLPDGRRYWPLVGLARYGEIGGILQYQLLQHGLDDVEMRLVTAGGPLCPEKERRLRQIVATALGHAFPIRFRYFEREIPGTEGGKFEEFVCLVRARDQ